MKKLFKSFKGKSNKSKGQKDNKNGMEEDELPGLNLLHKASLRGDIFAVTEASRAFDLNEQDSIEGKTALHFAACNGHLKIIKYLIDEKANTQIKCFKGKTPLFYAIEHENDDCANFFVTKGAFVTDDKDLEGQTLLHISCRFGNLGIFQKIFRRCPSLIIVPDDNGNFPIHVAILYTQIDICKFIYQEDETSREILNKIGLSPAKLGGRLHITTSEIQKAQQILMEQKIQSRNVCQANSGLENLRGEERSTINISKTINKNPDHPTNDNKILHSETTSCSTLSRNTSVGNDLDSADNLSEAGQSCPSWSDDEDFSNMLPVKPNNKNSSIPYRSSPAVHEITNSKSNISDSKQMVQQLNENTAGTVQKSSHDGTLINEEILLGVNESTVRSETLGEDHHTNSLISPGGGDANTDDWDSDEDVSIKPTKGSNPHQEILQDFWKKFEDEPENILRKDDQLVPTLKSEPGHNVSTNEFNVWNKNLGDNVEQELAIQVGTFTFQSQLNSDSTTKNVSKQEEVTVEAHSVPHLGVSLFMNNEAVPGSLLSSSQSLQELVPDAEPVLISNRSIETSTDNLTKSENLEVSFSNKVNSKVVSEIVTSKNSPAEKPEEFALLPEGTVELDSNHSSWDSQESNISKNSVNLLEKPDSKISSTSSSVNSLNIKSTPNSQTPEPVLGLDSICSTKTSLKSLSLEKLNQNLTQDNKSEDNNQPMQEIGSNLSTENSLILNQILSNKSEDKISSGESSNYMLEFTKSFESKVDKFDLEKSEILSLSSPSSFSNTELIFLPTTTATSTEVKLNATNPVELSDSGSKEPKFQLDQITSSEIFGIIESEPKLINNCDSQEEMNILFQSKKFVLVNENSSKCISEGNFLDKSIIEEIPIVPVAQRVTQDSKSWLENIINNKTETTSSSLLKVSEPIPFSSLLKDSVDILNARLNQYSTNVNIPVSPYVYNIQRKLSWPSSKIHPKDRSLQRRFSFQNSKIEKVSNDDDDEPYDEEQVNMILAQTMRILKKEIVSEDEPEDDRKLKSRDESDEVISSTCLLFPEEESVFYKDSVQGQAPDQSSNEQLYIKVGGTGRPPGINDESCCGPSSTLRSSNFITEYKEKITMPYQNDPVARYCESIPPGVDPNPQMIGDIIRDLHCVFEKTFGQRKEIESRYRNVQCELDELRNALGECECCKEELQQEICRLQAELRAAQYAFEEEAQRRLGLESIVAQLRAQMNRLEVMSEADMQEKTRLSNIIKEMELRMKQMTDAIACLQAERDQLLRNCRGFEEWKGRQVENLSMRTGKCDQLEEALAKCCKSNEILQREIADLIKERDRLKSCIEQLQNEKRRMAEEFDRERQCWIMERVRFEQTISDLKKALDSLTAQNQQICQKMNEVVSAHHAEMDCLRKEAEKFRMLYECEKGQREKLERALQDCEERKREMIMQQQQFQLQQQSTPYRDPCAEILSKFTSDRGEYTHDLKSRIDNANSKITGLEKDLQFSQSRLQEKIVAHDQAHQELQILNTKYRSLELDIIRAREEATILKSGTETLTCANMQLQKDLDAQNEIFAIRKSTLAQNEENLLNNNANERIGLELRKKEYEDNMSKTQLELKELNSQILKSEITVATVELDKKNWQSKYESLKKEKDELDRKYLEIHPVISEAQFYKKELERYQNELKEREEKLGKMTTLLHSAEENLRDSENRLTRVLEKDKDSPNLEAVIAELREKLKYTELERVRFEELAKSLEARLEYIQPKFDETFEQKKRLEERLIQTTDENRRLQRNVEEERVTRDLFQRELKDAQSLWESEVKAKGILAEKIAQSERINHHFETRNKHELTELDRFRDKFRQLKVELKAEREQVAKLKYKIDIQREQLRATREHLQEAANEPRSQKLIIQMDQMRAEHEKLVEDMVKDKEGLLAEVYRLQQELSATERGLKETREELQNNELNNEAVQELLKRKDRLEKEVQELRKALKERYVERSDVERWKAAYEVKLKYLKSEYTAAAEKEVNEKLSQYQTYFDRQTRDRTMIEELRDANENVLRTEYSQVTNFMKSDLSKLRSLVREREEEISSLKMSITHLKHKYSSEANMKEELLKQLQVLAASKTSLSQTSTNASKTKL